MSDKIRIYPIATDSAGCYYQRLRLPLDALEAKYPDEFEVCWTCEPKSGQGPAVALGQRIMGNGAEPHPGWAQLCEDPGILAVYEIDDDILDVDPSNAVPHSIFAPNRAGTAANIYMSNAVIASTNNLGRKIWESVFEGEAILLALIYVAPNCIADGQIVGRWWPQRDDYRPAIGWAGSMFHQQDFPPEIVAQFNAIAAKHPHVRWISIGANYLGRGSTYGWDTIPRYHARLPQLDIGLAVIQPTEFNASKSWIKALDYMAAGAIPVASDWGQYPELIQHDENGVLVSALPTHGPAQDVGNWFFALDWLLTLPPARLNYLRQAAQARAHEFQISKHVDVWASVFRKARDL